MMPQILQQLSGGLKISPQIMQMIRMIKSAGNPQLMISQVLQMNPQLRQAMEIIRDYGGDANKAFYAIAEKNGIDPEEIMNLIR